MGDFVFTARNIRRGAFGNEPGPVTYLEVDPNSPEPLLSHKLTAANWVKKVTRDSSISDLVIFIHGYCNDVRSDVMLRHRLLRDGLQKLGFAGDVISFDWPSGSNPLTYAEDRHDGKKTAIELVNSGIKLLAAGFKKDCQVNIHVIAHSAGAYVFHEAIQDSFTTTETSISNWVISQLMFISGDVSADSMSPLYASRIYQKCNRYTNYFNPYDSALAVSNAKRMGVANRVGRVGLPKDAPSKAVDINCGDYYKRKSADFENIVGSPSHSWYFYSEEWLKDVFATLKGEDRRVIETRVDKEGSLYLRF